VTPCGLAAELPMLLAEAGPYWVGIDAATVARVQRPEPGSPPADCDLDRLLGAERGRPVSRLLVVNDGQRTAVVGVSSTLDNRPVPSARLQPVPAVIRAAGAPPWWVGVAWLDGRLLLLIDLIMAAETATSPSG